MLERHVEEQRSQLGSTIGELQRLLDDPAGFRLAPTPVLLDPEVPAFEAAPEPEPAPAVEPEPEPERVPAPEQAAVVIDEAPSAPDLQFAEVDHAAPGTNDLPDAGPPTAPVSAVELGIDPPPPAPSAAAQAPAGGASGGGEEDAFLAELRKAMADDEPLGPREQFPTDGAAMFEDDDKRGWRFGKRR
ncbi:hypothetical protein [Aquihabitans sp. G128]|uniref:hypothetical protein n=1 Tax=Aquihabitans sp. G128 TaxID=2849779 RepID=UPI0020B29CA6|nr:hypothetical protein [Aquihabitans sp. G128]